MKIYLAGRYSDMQPLRDVACLLLMAGHKVTSRWLQGNVGYRDLPAERAEKARMCWDDVMECEQFVLFNHAEPATRQGHSVELGMVLGRRWSSGGWPLITLVGERSDNIFHWLPEVQYVQNWHALFEELDIPAPLVNMSRFGLVVPEEMPVKINLPQPRSIDAPVS